MTNAPAIRRLAASVMIIAACGFAGMPEASSGDGMFVAEVTGLKASGRLNVRSKKSPSASIVARLSSGTIVHVNPYDCWNVKTGKRLSDRNFSYATPNAMCGLQYGSQGKYGYAVTRYFRPQQ